MTPTGHHGPSEYAIRVQGRLGPGWSAWFDGLAVSSTEDGTTTIHGAVPDQAALHGLLNTLRDLGLPILSVSQAAPQPDDRAASPATPATSSEGRST